MHSIEMIRSSNKGRPVRWVRAREAGRAALPALSCALAVLGMLALSAAVPARALAAPGQVARVVYDGARDELKVEGAGEGDDLFASFKRVVPGDELVQDVELDIRHVDGPTSVHVRAEPAAGADAAKVAAILAGVTLTVEPDDSDGIEMGMQQGDPYEVFAGEGGAGVLVARTDRPMRANLRLTLDVPVDVGSEAADLMAGVRWTITATEESGESGSAGAPGGLPGTGDASRGATALAALGAAALAAGFAALSAGVVTRRRTA